jgi:serine/threonine protein kinase
MEYLRLGDLARFRDRDGPFPEKTAGLIVRQVLEGIRFMHEINFAHRDLKPGVSDLFLTFNLGTYRTSEHFSGI